MILSQTAMFDSLLWFAGVLVVLLVATVFLLWLRRRLRVNPQPSAGLGLTLSDLRRQLAQGRLTVEEFEALKKVVIRDVQAEPGETSVSSPDKVLQQGSKS